MDQLRLLQIKDDFCKKTIQRVMRNQKKDKQLAYPYYIKTRLLHKYIMDGKQRFEAQVIPANCADYLLRLAHNNLGHNGSARTYMLLRRNYYWKGIKPQVYRYVKQQCNSPVVKYNQGQFQVPKASMDFISMDLIGEFHPPTAEGYKYAFFILLQRKDINMP